MKNIYIATLSLLILMCVVFGIYLTCQMIFATYAMYGIWWFVWYGIAAVASIIFTIELVRTWTK